MAKKSVAEKEALELRDAVAQAMLDKKGVRVISLDLSRIDGAICRYFVICNAQSTTQVDAIAGNIEDHVYKVLGEKPRRSDGYENSLWIALDYIDVIAHVFQTEIRAFYRIEELWADAVDKQHTDEPTKKVTVKKSAAKVEKPSVKKSASKASVEKMRAATRKEARELELLEEEVAKKSAAKKTTARSKPTIKKAAAKPAAKKVTVKKTSKK
jgi:ribosome-associated protein